MTKLKELTAMLDVYKVNYRLIDEVDTHCKTFRVKSVRDLADWLFLNVEQDSRAVIQSVIDLPFDTGYRVVYYSEKIKEKTNV